MTLTRAVIVGAGQGGFQAAASLRQFGFDGTVTLIGDEPGLPYQRPPLSKAYLKTGVEEKLYLRPADFYTSKDIDYHEKARVASIDRAAQHVLTKDGRNFPYDHLILATGSRNRVPPIGNLGLSGVHAIRTLDDARRLRAKMPEIGHAIVVGGGFIGLEFAAVACAAGIKVSVVEGASRLMARAVSAPISQEFLAAHRAWGADVILNTFAADVLDDGQGNVAGLSLSDGRELAGDTVIVAAGVVPNSEIAAAAQLCTDDGIIVDEYLVTSDPTISALGDCCKFPDMSIAAHVRLESVQAATDHARTIAARLTGAPAAYKAIPWFWSDQGDLKLQIAGLSTHANAWQIVESAKDPFVVLCFRDEVFCAVETINAVAPHMAGRKLLACERKFQRSDLAKDDFDLRAAAKRLL